jgi:hypothetical protein
MIITFIIGVLIAKYRGCELKLGIKNFVLYPPMICELIYVILQIFVFQGNYQVIEFAEIFKKLYLLSFLVSIIMLKLYVPGLIGSAFILIGTGMNKLVMFFNNGKMPVFPSLSYLTGYVKKETFSQINDIHVLGGADTKLVIFSDIIDVGGSILSIGDVLIYLFTGIIVYATLVELNKRENKNFKLKLFSKKEIL